MTDTTGVIHAGAAAPAPTAEPRTVGVGPYKLAWRRLRRNKVATAFGVLFLVLVAMCLLAPVYSSDIAKIGPNTNNVTGTIKVGGKEKDVVSPDGVPIGPLRGTSPLIPALIIGVVYIPYLGKPIRGEVLRLREQDFIEAARSQGMGPWRIMLTEILPNAASTIIVFIPMMLAYSILL